MNENLPPLDPFREEETYDEDQLTLDKIASAMLMLHDQLDNRLKTVEEELEATQQQTAMLAINQGQILPVIEAFIGLLADIDVDLVEKFEERLQDKMKDFIDNLTDAAAVMAKMDPNFAATLQDITGEHGDTDDSSGIDSDPEGAD